MQDGNLRLRRDAPLRADAQCAIRLGDIDLGLAGNLCKGGDSGEQGQNGEGHPIRVHDACTPVRSQVWRTWENAATALSCSVFFAELAEFGERGGGLARVDGVVAQGAAFL